MMTHLPSAAEQARLLAAARLAYGVPEGIAITAASGTETLIRRLAALAPRPVAAETSYRTYGETFRIAVLASQQLTEAEMTSHQNNTKLAQSAAIHVEQQSHITGM